MLRDLWLEIPWPPQGHDASEVAQSAPQRHYQHNRKQATGVPDPAYIVSRDPAHRVLQDDWFGEFLTDLSNHCPGIFEQLRSAWCEFVPQLLQHLHAMTLLQHAVGRGKDLLDFSL